MSLSKHQRYAFVLLGVVLALGGVALASHWSTGGEYSGPGVIASSQNGPHVALPTNGDVVNLADAPVSDTELRVETHGGGNATFISNGYSKAKIEVLDSQWTNLSQLDVSPNPLTVDSDYGPQFWLADSPDNVSVRTSITPDDDTVDFVYEDNFGVTTIRVNGLTEGTVYSAVDGDGTILATNTSASDGSVTFQGMPSSQHNVTVQTVAGAPILSDVDPPEFGISRFEDTTISATVDDSDFPSDSVSVYFYIDGSYLGSDTRSTSGTVSQTATGLSDGTHTYRLVANDSAGNEASVENKFEVAHFAPQLGADSNEPSGLLTPTGDQTNAPSQIKFGATDEDIRLDGDNVSITVDVDGSQIATRTLDQNTADTGRNSTTFTVAMPASGQTAGGHTIVVSASDEYGNTETITSSYAVPDELKVRNETGINGLIDGQEVQATFYYDDGVIQRSTTDGTFDLTNLPVDKRFEIVLDPTTGYYSRTVTIQNIYEQQTAFLLSQNVSTVETRFKLVDPTGQFPDQSTLYVSKPIQIGAGGAINYRTVAADQFGVEGVTTRLQEGERYRLKIKAPDGTVQDMGAYRSEVSETVELRPAGPAVEIDNFSQNWGYGAELTNQTLKWQYFDVDSETAELTINIHERGNVANQLRANESYFGLGNASGKYSLTVNESELEYAVNFVVTREGETFTRTVYAGNTNDLTPVGLDEGWKSIVGVGSLVLFAGAFSVLNVGVGAVMLGVAGGILWLTGWLAGATTGIAIVIYLFFAVGYKVIRARP